MQNMGSGLNFISGLSLHSLLCISSLVFFFFFLCAKSITFEAVKRMKRRAMLHLKTLMDRNIWSSDDREMYCNKRQANRIG